MRTLRLGRTFDAVLIHDSIMYMTTEADLAAAALTAFVHTRPRGATLPPVHDRHVEGLFSRATWLKVLASVGFIVQMVERPLGDGTFDQVFLGTRPE